MLQKDKPQNPSLLDMFLQVESDDIRTKFNDASSATSKTEEEEDDILLEPDRVETTEDVLMSSISLDDSSHLLNQDDVDDEARNTDVLVNSTSNPSRQSFTSVVLPEETLFDAKEQRYEWNDEFSILKKLRRTRFSTVVEDDHAPMFQSTTS